eukprot:1178137-Alexandrium_andersonii.AAC.1
MPIARTKHAFMGRGENAPSGNQHICEFAQMREYTITNTSCAQGACKLAGTCVDAPVSAE